MQLSPHFALSEFASPAVVDGKVRRSPAERITPPARYHANLRKLAAALEMIRTALGGRPIRVLSGWRDPEFNALNKGRASQSQHLYGRAADLQTPHCDMREAYYTIRDLQRLGLVPKGGLAYYPGRIVKGSRIGEFVHYDIRGRNARWKADPKRP